MTERTRAVALGVFDGVHIGHQALLRQTVLAAESAGFEPMVLSFDIHPDLLTGQNSSLELIHSPADRAVEIRRVSGIRQVSLLHFDRETMNMPWQDFVALLAEKYCAGHVVAGYDFTFGRGGAGNAQLLSVECARLGIGCDIVPPVLVGGAPVSSSAIRRYISLGQMPEAALLLGRPYCFTAVVEGGKRLGRTIGVPTINQRLEPGVLTPAFGVYAARAYLPDGEMYAAVTNVGVRPTVEGGGHVNVESNLLDYSGDLYGQNVRLELIEHIRGERKFESLDALRRQIETDTAAVKEILAK